MNSARCVTGWYGHGTLTDRQNARCLMRIWGCQRTIELSLNPEFNDKANQQVFDIDTNLDRPRPCRPAWSDALFDSLPFTGRFLLHSRSPTYNNRQISAQPIFISEAVILWSLFLNAFFPSYIICKQKCHLGKELIGFLILIIHSLFAISASKNSSPFQSSTTGNSELLYCSWLHPMYLLNFAL